MPTNIATKDDPVLTMMLYSEPVILAVMGTAVLIAITIEHFKLKSKMKHVVNRITNSERYKSFVERHPGLVAFAEYLCRLSSQVVVAEKVLTATEGGSAEPVNKRLTTSKSEPEVDDDESLLTSEPLDNDLAMNANTLSAAMPLSPLSV